AVLTAEFANVVKRAAVNRTGPEFANGALVFRSGITFVAGETIPGIFPIQFNHQAVTVNLRNNGRGGDRKIDAVAFIETVLRLCETGNSPAVDEDVLRRNGQVRQRQLHGANTRMIDVDPVDVFNFYKSDCVGRCLFANFFVQTAACLFIERLGIVDTVDYRSGRKHNGSRYNRTGQRAHSHLVNSSDVLNASLPKEPLEVKHRIQAIALLL